MATFSSEGIIIKRMNFGEKDKILTLLTRSRGKIKTLAKGIRRVNSRRAGNVELFNFTQVHLAVGHTFNILTEAKLLETFPSLRTDLKKSSVAFYFSELADRFVPEEQENREIFGALLRSFRNLNHLGDISIDFIQNFEREMLELTGFGQEKEFEKEKPYLVLEKILGRELRSRRFLEKVWN